MRSPTPQNPGLLNWGLVLGLGVIWGSAFMGVSLSLDGIGPWWVAAGRLTLAALVLLGLGSAMGQSVWQARDARAWVFMACVGVLATALPIVLLSWGLTQVPSAFAGVTMGAVPLIVLPLVAIFSPDEGIGPRRVIGVVLGFVGLAVLFDPRAAFAGGSLWGQLACIGAAGGYAAGSVMTRRAPPIPPVAFATGALICGAIVLLPLAWMIEGPPRIHTPASGAALVYTALVPTALAAVLRVRVIKTAGSIFMSLTSYMVPLWAVLFGATLMDEALPPTLFVAMALILVGIGVSQSRTMVQQFRPSTRTK